jgi:hypothetical protein
LHLLKQQRDVIDALCEDDRCLMHPQSLAQSAIYLQIWANGELALECFVKTCFDRFGLHRLGSNIEKLR